MTPTAYIRVRSGTTGAIKAILTGAGRDVRAGDSGNNGFLSLTWHKKVNDVHIATWEMRYDHPDVALLSDKDQIEIIRSDPDESIAEYVSFDGLFRDDQVTYDTSDKALRIKLIAFGAQHMLTWRDIAYPAKKLNFTEFSSIKSETIMKRLVDYNCCANATIGNGRDRNGAISGLSIEADSARGLGISFAKSHQGNILDAVKQVAINGAGDFDVVKTGLTTYQFRFYPGQLGDDRTTGAAKVEFSLERANMANPKLVRNRSQERTVAIIGGAGQEDKRMTRTVTGSNYNVTTNNIETFVDARNSGVDIVLLEDLGSRALDDTRFRNVLTYDVLQTPRTQLEKHYFLGDLVPATFAGVTIIQQVAEIAFNYDQQNEKRSVVMRDK